MSFVEEVQRRVYAKTLLYTPWLPTERMQVGDYGSVRRGRFNREGNVRQRGITFEEDVATASPARLGFSDRASFNAKGVAKGRAASVAAGMEIALSGAGAFVYQLQDISSRRIADKDRFFRDLFLLILAGQLRWDDEFLLIDEVREAGSATLIVSETDSGKVVISGDVPLGPEGDAPLARARANVSAKVESGSIFQVLGQTSVTPLYNLRRLVFEPPGGPGSPVSAAIAWIKEKLGGVAMRPEDVHVGRYVAEDELEAFQLTLGKRGMTVLMRVPTVAIDEFLALGGAEEAPDQVEAAPEYQQAHVARRAAAAGF
jgi:hypothetical protein